MITWYVQMDALGNFWLNAETGKAPDTIRAAELIPRKVWSGPGDQRQVLAYYAARAQETINSCKRLATACWWPGSLLVGRCSWACCGCSPPVWFQ